MAMDFSDTKVTHFFTGTGVPHGAAVTYALHNTSLADPATIGASVHALFGAQVLPELSNTVTLQSTLVKNGPEDVGPSWEGGTPVVGGQSGAAASPNVAYLITKLTALGGRRNRGRFYLPGVLEGAINEAGTINPTSQGNIQAKVDTVLSSLDTAGWPMSILHSGAFDRTLVTDLVVSGVGATQRRRMRR